MTLTLKLPAAALFSPVCTIYQAQPQKHDAGHHERPDHLVRRGSHQHPRHSPGEQKHAAPPAPGMPSRARRRLAVNPLGFGASADHAPARFAARGRRSQVKIYNGNDSGEGVSEAEALSRLERACQHFLGMPENVIMQSKWPRTHCRLCAPNQPGFVAAAEVARVCRSLPPCCLPVAHSSSPRREK